MAEADKKDSKVTIEELTDNQVAVLHNILNSGFQIPAKIAIHVTGLQNWVARLAKERKIPEPKK